MIEPSEATTADREPEVNPEVIQDLDVPGDDADVIVGGRCTVAAPGGVVPGVTLVAT